MVNYYVDCYLHSRVNGTPGKMITISYAISLRVCLKEISVGGYSFTPPLTATGGGVKIFAFLLGGTGGVQPILSR